MPARLRQIVQALAQMGGHHEEPRNGSHWKTFKDGKMYPIPAHNGLRTEISDKYISGMCRSLGLDEDELRRYL